MLRYAMSHRPQGCSDCHAAPRAPRGHAAHPLPRCAGPQCCEPRRHRPRAGARCRWMRQRTPVADSPVQRRPPHSLRLRPARQHWIHRSIPTAERLAASIRRDARDPGPAVRTVCGGDDAAAPIPPHNARLPVSPASAHQVPPMRALPCASRCRHASWRRRIRSTDD